MVWKWVNVVMVSSWDFDFVNDIDEVLNISMDDKYKEENE